MTETLQLRGTLLGHNGWVTQIATNPKDPDTIISASRGKCDIVFIVIYNHFDNLWLWIIIREYLCHPLYFYYL